MTVVCVACAHFVPKSPERRRLQSDSDRHTLTEIVPHMYPDSVCHSCFGQLEKLKELTAEVRQLDAALAS